jgi:hypothetical protein
MGNESGERMRERSSVETASTSSRTMTTTTSHFKDPELQATVQKVINSDLNDPKKWNTLW